jgi:hypothetical protein
VSRWPRGEFAAQAHPANDEDEGLEGARGADFRVIFPASALFPDGGRMTGQPETERLGGVGRLPPGESHLTGSYSERPHGAPIAPA